MPKIKRNGKQFAVIKVLADGNCMFRAVIQSLMVQGILTDKRKWVIAYISNLVERTNTPDSLQPSDSYKLLIKRYEKLKLNKLDAFKKDFFDRKKNFFEEIRGFFYKKNNSFKRENTALYFLQERLRKDIYQYLSKLTPDSLGLEYNEYYEMLKQIGQSGEWADIHYVAHYFEHHKISVEIHRNQGNYMLRPTTSLGVEIENTNENEIKIQVLCPKHNSHYDVLVDPYNRFCK